MRKFYTLINLVLVISFGCTIPCFAQVENSNWCFGNNAKIDFNSSPPQATSCSIVLPSSGGPDIASVSNASGVLQFYTNGETIWDRNNQIMPNGTQLYGSSLGSFGHQILAVIPKPGYPNLYYLFTGSYGASNNPPSGREGLYYSIIDMNLGSGGEVLPGVKNIPLLDHSGIAMDYPTGSSPLNNGKITTALNYDGDKIWLVFLAKFESAGIASRYVYSYLVSTTGINGVVDGTSPSPSVSTPISNSNYPGQSINDWFGYIKISPNGSLLGEASPVAVNLYNFNNQIGSVSFNRQVYTGVLGVTNPGYGIEFSPNSQFLYFSLYLNTILQDGKDSKSSDSGYIRIYQTKITNEADSNKNILIGEFVVPKNDPSFSSVVPITNATGFSLQRAIDNKIYVCVFPFDWLGAIQNPDQAFPGCNFNQYVITLASGTSQSGNLPQWIHRANGLWPKAYRNDEEETFRMIKDGYGNFFIAATQIDFLPDGYYNHQGYFPVTSPVSLIQYNSTGVTTWISGPSEFPEYAFKSGVIQISSTPTIYRNGASGAIVPAPINLMPGEVILGETTNNEYLTMTFASPFQSVTLHARNSLGTIIASTFIGNDWPLGKFNPTTNNLLCYSFFNQIKVYNFNGTGFNQVGAASTMPLTPPYGNLNVVQIDNQDRLYLIEHNVLKRFDYQTGNLDIVQGFNNNSIRYIKNGGHYTDNNLVVFNEADLYLYYINEANAVVKKIYCPDFNAINLIAEFDNSDVYLFGEYYSPFQIGTQSFPLLPFTTYSNIFFTKLSLQGDFQRFERFITRSEENILLPSLTIDIKPNPVSSTLSLVIDQGKKNVSAPFKIIISTQMGKEILVKEEYLSESEINVSHLKSGLYFVSVISKLGEKKSSTFFKY